MCNAGKVTALGFSFYLSVKLPLHTFGFKCGLGLDSGFNGSIWLNTRIDPRPEWNLDKPTWESDTHQKSGG